MDHGIHYVFSSLILGHEFCFNFLCILLKLILWIFLYSNTFAYSCFIPCQINETVLVFITSKIVILLCTRNSSSRHFIVPVLVFELIYIL